MLARATGAWEAAKATGARSERWEYNRRLPALPLTLIHQVPRRDVLGSPHSPGPTPQRPSPKIGRLADAFI
jgi:hypothetical protein